MRTIIKPHVLALALLFPTGSKADEFNPDFVGQIVSGCVEWLDTGERTIFDTKWLLSAQTARDLQLAEKYPELEPTSLHFYSHGLSSLAMLLPHTSSCMVSDNFSGVDESGVVVSPAVAFNFQSALNALHDWGAHHADRAGFVDWPEGAEQKQLSQRGDFVFFKKNCNNGILTTIQATAETERPSVDGLPLPAWQLVVSRYSVSDESFRAYVLSACPQTS